MREVIIGTIKEKIKVLFDIEVIKRLRYMKVDETRDRLRIIFEFEFDEELIHSHLITKRKVIRDAVEIRHRRPWK